jgi:CHAT domain-containing protein
MEAECFLADYAKDGDPLHILRLGQVLTEKASALGDSDPAAPLRLRAQLLHRDLLDGVSADPGDKLAELEAIEAEFARAKAWDDVATSRLSLGHVNAHLGNSGIAIGWFVAALEAQTKLGDDPGIPVLTAGNAERLRPYYEALIHALIEAGNHRAAFLVAERCKSELWRRMRPKPRLDLAALIEAPAVDPASAGMISFFVDAEGVILFWTTCDGAAHSARMGIPRARLESYVAAVRANGWRPVGLFTPSNVESIRALGGLLKPAGRDLLNAMPERLTISPDGILHNVPWHLLQVGPVPLIQRHSVRTVLCLEHAAFVAKPSQAERRISVFTVPSVSDCGSGWAQWAEAVCVSIAPAGGEVDLIGGREGTLGALIARIHDSYLHIRCHGHFPEGADVTAEDAYRRSGLLLAVSGLPERSAEASLAAPKDFIELGLVRAQPSGHVALEACVSGIVHDGAAGDPVSLPWVLALQGARTIVTSLWNVETAHAEAFFSCYYAQMSGQDRSAGEAHRIATVEMLRRFGPAAAAFRLLGNDL